MIPTDPAEDSRPPAPPTQVDLALDRTFLAYERTLMAWLRTSLSMVTFGFTLFKAFLYLEQSGKLVPGRQILNPRTFGLLIIALGIIALVAAICQHIAGLRRMRVHTDRIPRSLALGPAILFCGLAIVAFVVSYLERG